MHITQSEIIMTYINMGLIILLIVVITFACIRYSKRKTKTSFSKFRY